MKLKLQSKTQLYVACKRHTLSTMNGSLKMKWWGWIFHAAGALKPVELQAKIEQKRQRRVLDICKGNNLTGRANDLKKKTYATNISVPNFIRQKLLDKKDRKVTIQW